MGGVSKQMEDPRATSDGGTGDSVLLAIKHTPGGGQLGWRLSARCPTKKRRLPLLSAGSTLAQVCAAAGAFLTASAGREMRWCADEADEDDSRVWDMARRQALSAAKDVPVASDDANPPNRAPIKARWLPRSGWQVLTAEEGTERFTLASTEPLESVQALEAYIRRLLERPSSESNGVANGSVSREHSGAFGAAKGSETGHLASRDSHASEVAHAVLGASHPSAGDGDGDAGAHANGQAQPPASDAPRPQPKAEVSSPERPRETEERGGGGGGEGDGAVGRDRAGATGVGSPAQHSGAIATGQAASAPLPSEGVTRAHGASEADAADMEAKEQAGMRATGDAEATDREPSGAPRTGQEMGDGEGEGTPTSAAPADAPTPAAPSDSAVGGACASTGAGAGAGAGAPSAPAPAPATTKPTEAPAPAPAPPAVPPAAVPVAAPQLAARAVSLADGPSAARPVPVPVLPAQASAAAQDSAAPPTPLPVPNPASSAPAHQPSSIPAPNAMDVDAGSPTGAPLSQGTKRPLPDDSGEQSQGASLAPVSRVSRGESEEVVDGVGQDAVVGELFHRERPRGIDKRGLPFEHLGPMELVVNEARGTFDVWAVEYHGRRRRYLFGKQTREEAVGAMEVFEREYTSRIFQKGAPFGDQRWSAYNKLIRRLWEPSDKAPEATVDCRTNYLPFITLAKLRPGDDWTGFSKLEGQQRYPIATRSSFVEALRASYAFVAEHQLLCDQGMSGHQAYHRLRSSSPFAKRPRISKARASPAPSATTSRGKDTTATFALPSKQTTRASTPLNAPSPTLMGQGNQTALLQLAHFANAVEGGMGPPPPPAADGPPGPPPGRPNPHRASPGLQRNSSGAPAPTPDLGLPDPARAFSGPLPTHPVPASLSGPFPAHPDLLALARMQEGPAAPPHVPRGGYYPPGPFDGLASPWARQMLASGTPSPAYSRIEGGYPGQGYAGAGPQPGAPFGGGSGPGAVEAAFPGFGGGGGAAGPDLRAMVVDAERLEGHLARVSDHLRNIGEHLRGVTGMMRDLAAVFGKQASGGGG